jgi:hypothetical protein
MRAAVVLAVAALLAACSGGDDKIDEATLSVRIEATEAEIQTRIGPALCSLDSDCRALPMGALACGGPSRFLPYSIRNTDVDELMRRSAEHQRLSAEQLAASGPAVGPCIALVPPLPSCELLSCKLR